MELKSPYSKAMVTPFGVMFLICICNRGAQLDSNLCPFQWYLLGAAMRVNVLEFHPTDVHR